MQTAITSEAIKHAGKAFSARTMRLVFLGATCLVGLALLLEVGGLFDVEYLLGPHY